MIGEIVASILILTGVALALTAAIGMLRFPDLFARMHSATKPVTLGLVLILAGCAVLLPSSGDTAKLVLVIVLQFVTIPVGAHMVGRAAYRAGTELPPETTIDELADAERSGGDGPA